MKNTSIWFYVPNIIFLVLLYGILRWDETIFWEGDKDYVLIFLGLCTIVISLFIRMKKLDQHKKEYYWVHYALVGLWLLILLLPML